MPEVTVERLLFLPWLSFSVHPKCGVDEPGSSAEVEEDGGVGVVGDIVG